MNPKALKGYGGKPYWDIPGGRIEKGDSDEKTLRREVEEETGIKEIRKIEKFDMVLSNIRIPTDEGSVGLILAIYLCDIGDVEEIGISDEHVTHNFFPSSKAAKLLEFKYPKEFIEKIRLLTK